MLTDHPFTRDLEPSDLEALMYLATVRKFAAGDLLIEEGKPADSFYLLIAGHAGVELHLPGSGVQRLQTIGPGEAAGWSWAIPPHVCAFDIRALEPVSAVAFHGPALRQLCQERPGLGYQIMFRLLKTVSGRLRNSRLQLLDIYR